MGRYIEIKKHKIVERIHYYEVNPLDSQQDAFFIGIDPERKSILYFKDNNFSQPLYTYLVAKPQDIKLDWLPTFLVYAPLIKAKEALEKMEFPEYLSFQS